MFWPRGAILRQSYKTKKDKSTSGLEFLCFRRLPKNGIPVPKDKGFDTCHELYFITCICWLIYWLGDLLHINNTNFLNTHTHCVWKVCANYGGEFTIAEHLNVHTCTDMGTKKLRCWVCSLERILKFLLWCWIYKEWWNCTPWHDLHVWMWPMTKVVCWEGDAWVWYQVSTSEVCGRQGSLWVLQVSLRVSFQPPMLYNGWSGRNASGSAL
jgi:hypothetical protein